MNDVNVIIINDKLTRIYFSLLSYRMIIYVYLSGSGGSYTPPRGLPKSYMMGFKGCMDLVKIGDEKLDLVMDRKDKGPTQYCDLIPL